MATEDVINIIHSVNAMYLLNLVEVLSVNAVYVANFVREKFA